jgi:catechol 2,3-dioxygenase-like lactoylglutathione lyase family enzyme
MPNIDNLKKQAKRHVRWHREGRITVCTILRAGLPRFAALTDQEILAQPFRLADAQELVARKAGFETWQALKQGLEPMADRPVAYPSQPILMNAEPMLFVTDFPRSLSFFTAKLGFKVAFTYGDPPFFGQVGRDAALMALRLVDRPVLARGEHRDLLSASIWVTNARQLFLEYQAAGVPFHQPLRSEPWHGQGQGGFIVEDPDGNLISFGGRTD